jgi:DNA modification methylase
MKQFCIVHHSSKLMPELKSESIDLVVTDPPWNMGVKFGDRVDLQEEEEYQTFMRSVIHELFRVIHNDGLCIIVCAKKVRYAHKTTNLADTYKRLFVEQHFSFEDALPIIITGLDDAVGTALPISTWEDQSTTHQAYSEEGMILIFSKKKGKKTKAYQQIKKELHDDWSTDITYTWPNLPLTVSEINEIGYALGLRD